MKSGSSGKRRGGRKERRETAVQIYMREELTTRKKKSALAGHWHKEKGGLRARPSLTKLPTCERLRLFQSL